MKTQAQVNPKDVYQIVTDKIIAKLEQGFIPWKKPWSFQGVACNYISQKAYKGINALLLNFNDYEQPYYLTFNQVSQLGGKVKKGAKSEIVTYWNWFYEDKQTGKKLSAQQATGATTGNVKKSAFLKYYNVFNVKDIEGIDFQFPTVQSRPEHEKIEYCEQIIGSIPSPPKIEFGGNQAWYSPRYDIVTMPQIQHFHKAEYFYSVFFHELSHSTGHHTRLARKLEGQINPYGSAEYSKEELVAELTACFLCGFVGIEQQTIENSAAYLQGWLQVFNDDKKILIEAAGKAQQASDYILNVSSDLSEEDATVSA